MAKRITDNKKRIMDASITVFTKKGFNATTISDLAKEAGLGEATIYNYFKNKLEILLDLPIPILEDFIRSCEEQLQGIKNPVEKMRKFIWQYLRWCQNHKDYIKVLFADILSTPQVYHSKAYELMRQVIEVPMHIFDHGKKEGSFQQDVSTKSFGHFLFGTINYWLLIRIRSKKSFILLDDFDYIAEIILTAINEKEDFSRTEIKSVKDKRERILLAAEMLYSQKGYAEITISEIAKTAHMADATIYSYFKNKEDLLFQIFNKRMKEFSITFNEIISPIGAVEKLKLAIFHFLMYVQANRQWAKVYVKNVSNNPRFFLSKEYELAKQYDRKIVDIFLDGKKNKIFRADLTIEFFRALIFGPILNICRTWAVLETESSLSSELAGLYTLFFSALKKT